MSLLPDDLLAGQSPDVRQAVEARLRSRLEDARAALPGVSTSDRDFVRYLAQKVAGGTDESVLDAMDRIRVTDMLLACACVQKDPAALAHFEDRYLVEVDAAWRRFDALGVTLDDVRQRMRERLFLATPPSLEGYSGRGDLRNWVRVAALHMLSNIATRESRERPTEETFFDDVVDLGADTEAVYLKHACGDEFKEAFAAALERLSARERLLLRYAFADRRTVDEIGSAFRVHRATAARWIAKARQRLVDETRAALMTALQVDEGEAASIVRAALSRAGTTLLRGLA